VSPPVRTSGPAARRASAIAAQRAPSPAEPRTIRASKLAPVARPTFASGKRRHHQVSRMGSVVASAAPWEGNGWAPTLAQAGSPQEQPTAAVRRLRTAWCRGMTGRPRPA
jgi:hypothetical protein